MVKMTRHIRNRQLLLAGLLMFLGSAAQAQETPLGLWKSIDEESGEAKSLIRITERDGVLSGRIERIFDPARQQATCRHCEDERKDQRVIGMEIIRHVRKAEDEAIWEGGEILDPQKGKTYRVRLTPQNQGKLLQVRGYLGPFFRTQIWQRQTQ